MALEWKLGALDPIRFIDRLAELGYKAYPFETASAEALEAEQSRFLLRCLAVAAFATMNVMMLSIPVWSGNVSDMIPEQRDFFHWLSALIALPAAAYAGQPFFRSAFRVLRTGNVNMDVPIAIGVILALGMSVVETINHAEHTYFDAAIMPYRRDNAALGEVSSDRINHRGLLADEQMASAVKHQAALLLRRLCWHEPHVGSGDCLADRLGISRIVLRSLDVGLGERSFPWCREMVGNFGQQI